MAQLQLYNSASKQKEVFKPIVEGKVGMYVCGVTVYDFSHIGHARAYVAFDVLYRYLKYLGYDVVYLRNFTDVDDKIIHRANDVGEDSRVLSGRFIQEFVSDMADLQCLVPTHQPRVTDHIEQIKAMISKIISNGHAYAVDGDVYFSVGDFPNYGGLSGRNPEDNKAGERVSVDTRKRNPADFALWKAAKVGEPQWDSPWGPGRPGWHIECSAMSAHYLTHTFDIHGGGMDLIFPHHENEIAQSCAACPHSKVNYWMHNGFVTINDDKMAKSTANFFTIREVTKLYHPLALRHFLLGTHYRSPVNYSISQIEIASETIFYIYQTLQDCEDALSPFKENGVNESDAQVCIQLYEEVMDSLKDDELNDELKVSLKKAQDCIKNLHNQMETKLGDDLHTPSILNADLPEALRSINTGAKMLKDEKEQKIQLLNVKSLTYLEEEVKQVLEQKIRLLNVKSLIYLEEEVKQVLDVLGLLSNATCAEVLQQLKDKALKRADLSEDDIFLLIEERRVSRKNKDFSRADEIRNDLGSKGITLMDVGNGTLWRPSVPREKLH